MIKNYILFLIFFLAILDLCQSQRSRGREHNSNDFVNLSVNRTIYLKNSITIIESYLQIKSLKVDPLYSYRYAILKNNTKHLINISAKLFNLQNDNEEIKLKISKQSYTSDDTFDFYEINFKNEPINFEEDRYIMITEDYYENLDMLPKKIALRDNQYVVFKDTINQVSFYQTNTQIIDVILKSEKTEVV
jgi:hypothetical protein